MPPHQVPAPVPEHAGGEDDAEQAEDRVEESDQIAEAEDADREGDRGDDKCAHAGVAPDEWNVSGESRDHNEQTRGGRGIDPQRQDH